MDKQESRRQFEEWFRIKHEGQMIAKGSGYSDPITQLMWQAWQASRAAIVVEFPDSTGIECIVCADVAIKRCEDSIRSIGLSIKGE